MDRIRVIILGAAGRDFHDFNVLFRNNPGYEVAAFTANQIPFISNRTYPKELSGKLYPKGIPIFDESLLPKLIKRYGASVCILAYSDLPYATVMHKSSAVNAAGADFWLIAPSRVMLKSNKPVIAVCAARTGSGKSQTSRYICRYLKSKGLKTVVIRHPMPYGILKDQIIQRYSKLKDLDKYKCTIEEREDYEPHIRNGFILYSGVDYEKILRAAEKEADVILFDGGNNDASFIRPDLLIMVLDPFRPSDQLSYYPSESVARNADVFLVNKVNSAPEKNVKLAISEAKTVNKRAKVVLGESIVTPDNPRIIKGASALVIEDGPTITHGGMPFGAGTVAAKLYKVGRIVNAKKYAVGTIKDTFVKYPQLDKELPAMGYSPKQIRDMQATINRAECDIVISATPTNLRGILDINKPFVQVYYELKPKGKGLDAELDRFAKRYGGKR
jgi:predicted GTPase